MIVYRTENKVNGKFYYGVHQGDNPKYLGSGVALKNAIKKYGRKNFIRRTIMKFDTAEEAYAFEALMVDDALLNDPNCYNSCLGGVGGVGKNEPWNKGKKTPGIGSGRKPGFVSHHKGKYKSPWTIIAKELGTSRRIIKDWVVNNRKPHQSNQSTYAQAIKLYNLMSNKDI